MRGENGTDRAAKNLELAVQGIAPDYIAPALTSMLVKTAIKIGLSKEVVCEQVATLFDLAASFKASELETKRMPKVPNCSLCGEALGDCQNETAIPSWYGYEIVHDRCIRKDQP